MQENIPPSPLRRGILMQIMVVRYTRWQIGKVFPLWGNGKGASGSLKTLGYREAFVMQKIHPP